MGEHGILSAGNGLIHQGRRKDRHGADFHGHHLGERQIVAHGVQGVSLTAGFTYAKAPAVRKLADDASLRVDQFPGSMGQAPLFYIAAHALPEDGGELAV